MIYVTGDIHGDIGRFKLIKKQVKLKKRDTLIICGDFGFVWDGSKGEKRTLKRLGKKRYNILFVDGVNENHELLETYPEEDWCGGITRKISGNLRMLMRGCMFTIEGKKIFAFGGGENDEKTEIGLEYPNEHELERGLQNLKLHDNKADFIISHDAPTMIAEFLNLPTSERDHLNRYLDSVASETEFGRWYFGRHHVNKIISSKYIAVFDKVFNIESDAFSFKNKFIRKNERIR